MVHSHRYSRNADRCRDAETARSKSSSPNRDRRFAAREPARLRPARVVWRRVNRRAARRRRRRAADQVQPSSRRERSTADSLPGAARSIGRAFLPRRGTESAQSYRRTKALNASHARQMAVGSFAADESSAMALSRSATARGSSFVTSAARISASGSFGKRATSESAIAMATRSHRDAARCSVMSMRSRSDACAASASARVAKQILPRTVDRHFRSPREVVGHREARVFLDSGVEETTGLFPVELVERAKPVRVQPVSESGSRVTAGVARRPSRGRLAKHLSRRARCRRRQRPPLQEQVCSATRWFGRRPGDARQRNWRRERRRLRRRSASACATAKGSRSPRAGCRAGGERRHRARRPAPGAPPRCEPAREPRPWRGRRP